MVFGGEITFSIPQKLFRPPIFFFGPPMFFFGGFLFFYAPKTKNRLFWRAPNEQYFSMPKRKNLGFFKKNSAPPRYGVRRPNHFFDPPKIFCGGFFLFFTRSEKPPFFGAKKQKSAFSAGVEGSKA